MLTPFIAALNEETITPTAKGLPHRAYGASVAQFLSTEPRIEEFWTPLVAISEEAMDHNIALLTSWTRERDLGFMPHGKTMMSPSLWQRQLDAGAEGIALATLGQVRMGRAAGLSRIQLANEAVDPLGLAWLAGELHDENFEFTCWVDSFRGVELMERALAGAGAPRKVDVLIELGVAGGRTGVRGLAAARELAERVAESDWLRLAGVSGYEGVVGGNRERSTVEAAESFLAEQVELHHALADLYDDGPLMVTAGGSAFFDLVATAYARGREGAPESTSWVIRSGAYLTHDEGHYRGLSPLDEEFVSGQEALIPALTGYARVVSAPESGLVLADAGRRDLPYDLHLPFLRGNADTLAGPFQPIAGEVTGLNDQHAFVSVDGESPPVGSVLSFGVSHPCTTFDKWVYLPVVTADGRVTDLVRTFF